MCAVYFYDTAAFYSSKGISVDLLQAGTDGDTIQISTIIKSFGTNDGNMIPNNGIGKPALSVECVGPYRGDTIGNSHVADA